MEDITIDIQDIVKTYKLYNKPIDRLKESLSRNTCYHKLFYAVNGVSFTVRRGETVGIIGRNGAGKSTILKMITGVLTPSSGQIYLSGTVAALLELGTGFDAEKNGIENIYLNGRINGLTKKQIEESIDDVLEFADIGDFIYQPIKTYSSGMLVRLAFATAIHVNPDILIVDEALSVGEIRFQQKCYRKIREFKEKGTVLFVSHDTGAIASFCDRVIWLDNGKIFKEGIPGEILKEYLAFMRYDIKPDSSEDDVSQITVSDSDIPTSGEITSETDNNTCHLEFGTNAAQFTKIQLLDKEHHLTSQVCGGQEIIIRMELIVREDINAPIFGFNIKDTLGNELVVTNTVFEEIILPTLYSGRLYCFEWKFNFPLFHAGDYPLDVALANGTYQNHEQVHFVADAIIIKCADKLLYQEGRGRYILDHVELEQIDLKRNEINV